ncbi:MAG: hypothetical protein PHP11_03730 [Erysipelotrichaceae bacterium]|nr:hypothetical protein [Erysipelotrichaceae bacterium]
MKNFFNKIAFAFQRFMYGRYGLDQLGYALLIFYSLVLIMANLFLKRPIWLDYLLMIVLILFYFRIFSKNVYRRSKENAYFMRFYNPLKNFIRKKRTRIKKMKDYRYFRCPKCKSELRVPKGRGKIEITCPSCHHRFERKS